MEALGSTLWPVGEVSDRQIASNVRIMFDRLLDICADRVLRDGWENWRTEKNASGCTNNAQLWILGQVLTYPSTKEVDAELQKRVELRRRS